MEQGNGAVKTSKLGDTFKIDRGKYTPVSGTNNNMKRRNNMKNKMKIKASELDIVACTIDEYIKEMDYLVKDIDNHTQRFNETGEEWYKERAQELSTKLDAYVNVIAFLEKYH